MAKGHKTGGRQAGSKNKHPTLTRALDEALVKIDRDLLGGNGDLTEALVELYKTDLRLFWTLAGKRVTTQVEVTQKVTAVSINMMGRELPEPKPVEGQLVEMSVEPA